MANPGDKYCLAQFYHQGHSHDTHRLKYLFLERFLHFKVAMLTICGTSDKSLPSCCNSVIKYQQRKTPCQTADRRGQNSDSL